MSEQKEKKLCPKCGLDMEFRHEYKDCCYPMVMR
jgi:hypothetical protein